MKNKKRKMLTFMIIPHSTSKPISLEISWEFLFSIIVVIVGVVAWAIFIVNKQVDFWAVKAENKILSKQTEYYTKEMLQARQMTDELKEMERELKKLLQLKSKKEIIQTGGPTSKDLERIAAYLEKKELVITPQEFNEHLQAFKMEASAVKEEYFETSSFIKAERSKWRATPCIPPVLGPITSDFGFRIHPIKGYSEIHLAIDIAAERGTEIKAPADGEVILADYQPGYGKLIVIEHGWGYMTRYGHCYKLLVKSGQKVTRGQVIALVGSTGNATAAHLHYEVWKNRVAQNPRKYLVDRMK